MQRDVERLERVRAAIEGAELDGLLCSTPTNVLLVSGYYPVIGNALAITTRRGRTVLIVPEDEGRLARRSWADDVRTFSPGSVHESGIGENKVRELLRGVLEEVGAASGRIGYESGPMHLPASYASMHLYGESVLELLSSAAPAPIPASELLANLRAVKTQMEIARIRRACIIAERAYRDGASQLRAGVTERQAAWRFRRLLGGDRVDGNHDDRVERADGFTFCMSGPNSALAFAAYQQSRRRELSIGDFALIHCNSFADGYWTDITRTYCLGRPDAAKGEMYSAVFAARQAALNEIRPDARASDVDAAARDAFERRGFGGRFKHGTGHEVGFGAISHDAPPRLNPISRDVLEVGMVFNVEPGIYVDGYGGLRHCDMVAVTGAGAEVLTPFHSRIEELVIE